jgi:hypothetical protein
MLFFFHSPFLQTIVFHCLDYTALNNNFSSTIFYSNLLCSWSCISITQNNLSLGGFHLAIFKPLPKSSIDDPMHPKGFSLQYSLCNFVAASFRQGSGFMDFGLWQRLFWIFIMVGLTIEAMRNTSQLFAMRDI